MLSLKRLDNDIYCSHCTLRSRIRQEETTPRSPSMSISYSEPDRSLQRRRLSLRNNYGQLSLSLCVTRARTVTVRKQLSAALHDIHLHMSNTELSSTLRHLIRHNAHDFPPAH